MPGSLKSAAATADPMSVQTQPIQRVCAHVCVHSHWFSGGPAVYCCLTFHPNCIHFKRKNVSAQSDTLIAGLNQPEEWSSSSLIGGLVFRCPHPC